MVAKVVQINGIPAIEINGSPVMEMAYITYRPEYNKYYDFSNNGVKLFSINLNFSEMPINEMAPVLVFQKGIFEKDVPDFSIVDHNFDLILKDCPDACIFPRVNLNLPERWEREHPLELCEKGFGDRCRFSYASDIWAEDVKKYLTQLIDYIENSKYKEHIIGYQLSAGNTEEWLAIDPQSGYGIRAKEKFATYCGEREIPANEENYYKFMSEIVASRISDFAHTVKKLTNHEKLVGCFYGYTLYVGRNHCHNALEKILDCENIDFICSPLSYADIREPGIDLYAMVPVASVRHHKKVYFSENDIRTHLSRPISDHPNYTLPIWYGHDKDTVIEQMKLAFSRAMLHGYGLWWFDMWGGWYDDSQYMELIHKMSQICEKGMDTPDVEVAVYVDENSIVKTENADSQLQKVFRSVGLCASPYDAYLISDFENTFEKYKACIFVELAKTRPLEECIKKAQMSSKEVLIINDIVPTENELYQWLKDAGIVSPINCPGVVYRGEKYISFYTSSDGEYDFCDRGVRVFRDMFSDKTISFPTRLSKGQFFMFKRKSEI
ncbi:MAG: hypothetical protein IKV88_07105 [Clostridia bacterium]|nr:hypothetical protein [Clostridia bacterium]